MNIKEATKSRPFYGVRFSYFFYYSTYFNFTSYFKFDKTIKIDEKTQGTDDLAMAKKVVDFLKSSNMINGVWITSTRDGKVFSDIFKVTKK